MAKKKTALRRVFKAPIELHKASEEKIIFLSRCLIHLWNMALEECEKWLEATNNLKKIVTTIETKGSVIEYVELPDGSKIPGDEVCMGIAKEMIKQFRISAYSLNYWLVKTREQEITLDDGTQVRLDAISSDIEREVLRKLAGSYQSFFALKKNKDFRARKPQPKKEGWFQTMSWSSFKIQDGVLFVSGYSGERIEIPLTVATAGHTSSGDYLKKNIAGEKVVFVTLSRDRYTGQLILSLVTSEPLPQEPKCPKFFRAIDLGAGHIAVTDSDGGEYLIPTRRPDKFWMDRIGSVEGRQEKRVKGSRGFRRLAQARRYMHARSRKQKDSHQKKVADALVSEGVECIIVGKSKTRLGLSRTESAVPAQHYGTQNTGYMFRQLLYLRSKAEERGVRFLELPDPRRKGKLEDPRSKFHASRELLREGLKAAGSEIPAPRSFQRKQFEINFGKGVPKKVGP